MMELSFENSYGFSGSIFSKKALSEMFGKLLNASVPVVILKLSYYKK